MLHLDEKDLVNLNSKNGENLQNIYLSQVQSPILKEVLMNMIRHDDKKRFSYQKILDCLHKSEEVYEICHSKVHLFCHFFRDILLINRIDRENLDKQQVGHCLPNLVDRSYVQISSADESDSVADRIFRYTYFVLFLN